jgi:hypothetical protein
MEVGRWKMGVGCWVLGVGCWVLGNVIYKAIIILKEKIR